MNKDGALILVEDDPDDQKFILDALKEIEIKNEILLFDNGDDAFKYLSKNDIEPFLIISDINMPKMTGTELRDKVQTHGATKLRAVPFLFLTTGSSNNNLVNQYAHSVQGYFQKANTFDELKRTFRRIIEYWQECMPPYFKESAKIQR